MFLWWQILVKKWIDVKQEEIRLMNVGLIVWSQLWLTHNFDLGYSRSKSEIAVSQECEGRFTWSETIWIDKILNLLCDLELWPWPWIFKANIRKSRKPGMGWPIDMERKGCESIGRQTQFVTEFYLTRDLDLGFSGSNFEKVISQGWECWDPMT